MKLTHITVNNLRNINELSLGFSSKFNVLCGENGSGKSSILEAIYILGTGRSFRASSIQPVIANLADELCIHGLVKHKNETPLGIQKSRTGGTKIRISEQPERSISALAKHLPLQILEPDSHQLLTDGPKYRRQFIDWGLFHVEPSFFTVWQSFQRVLKQRNACLKNGFLQQIPQWNEEFIVLSNKITQFREKYVETLTPLFTELFITLLGLNNIEISYFPGWDAQQSLEEALNTNRMKEQAVGHTSVGPHRANLQLSISNSPIEHIFSRGQQKLAVYAMHLAQGHLFHKQMGVPCIFLLDDLSSELDINNRNKVYEVLNAISGQVFITGVDERAFSDLKMYENTALFHVEQDVKTKFAQVRQEELTN